MSLRLKKRRKRMPKRRKKMLRRKKKMLRRRRKKKRNENLKLTMGIKIIKLLYSKKHHLTEN